MQTQTFVITETMTTLPAMILALLGAGALLHTILIIRMVLRIAKRKEKKDDHRGVTEVVTARVYGCVEIFIHFVLFGQRVYIPEFRFGLTFIQRVALITFACFGFRLLGPIITLLIITILTVLTVILFYVARWLHRFFYAWSHASQDFKDCVVQTIAIPATALLCMVLVLACWIIVIPLCALKCLCWLSFRSVCSGLRLIYVLFFGQVQQQQQQQPQQQQQQFPSSTLPKKLMTAPPFLMPDRTPQNLPPQCSL